MKIGYAVSYMLVFFFFFFWTWLPIAHHGPALAWVCLLFKTHVPMLWAWWKPKASQCWGVGPSFVHFFTQSLQLFMLHECSHASIHHGHMVASKPHVMGQVHSPHMCYMWVWRLACGWFGCNVGAENTILRATTGWCHAAFSQTLAHKMDGKCKRASCLSLQTHYTNSPL